MLPIMYIILLFKSVYCLLQMLFIKKKIHIYKNTLINNENKNERIKLKSCGNS